MKSAIKTVVLALAFVPVVYNMGHKFEVTPELPAQQRMVVGGDHVSWNVVTVMV